MNITVQSIKDEFDANVDRHEHHIVDRGMQGAIVGTLEAACGKKPENRHRLLKMLCGVTSSKELSSPQWSALYSLVLPFKPEGGKWISGNPNLEEICTILLNADMNQPGQTQMFDYPEFQEIDQENPF